jgi:hypothetical protein
MIQLLQRTAKKRLGYNGMSEVLLHPWLFLKYEQRIQFLERRVPSPIVPLEVTFSASLQQETEPDAVWRENIFLLKRPDIQSKCKFMKKCSRDTTSFRAGRAGKGPKPAVWVTRFQLNQR